MGRTPKPWWREDRGAYYATVRGVRHRLGVSLKQAKATLKQLLKSSPQEQNAPPDYFSALLDDFLTFTEENKSPKTYRGYKDFCQSFLGVHPHLKVDDLTTGHVTTWLNRQTTWNSTTKHGAVTCLKRALNWAMNNRGLHANPLRSMEKSESKPRTEIITLAEFKKILRATPDKVFRDMLRFCWETGCRPEEAKALERRHLEIDKSRFVIPAAEAKNKKRPRVIYVTPKAEVIVARLLRTGEAGKLFKNKRGRAWTASAVKCRFQRLEKKLGRRYFHYMFRHTWITRKLKAGVDSHVVGVLAGHKDTKMIDKVYSHVADDHGFMLSMAQKE